MSRHTFQLHGLVYPCLRTFVYRTFRALRADSVCDGLKCFLTFKTFFLVHLDRIPTDRSEKGREPLRDVILILHVFSPIVVWRDNFSRAREVSSKSFLVIFNRGKLEYVWTYSWY